VRALSSIEEALFGRGGYNAHARVKIADEDGVMRDYGALPEGPNSQNWVASVEWVESNDMPTATATIRLFRASFLNSIAPLQDSRLNRNAAGAYARILDIGRRVTIEVAVSGSDAGPSGWVLVFEGKVFEVNWGEADNNEVTVSCRDQGGEIIDTFIEQDKVVYAVPAGSPVQDIMQDILDANLGAFVVTLSTPVAPGWNIRPYQQDRMATGEAIRRLAAMIGWDVRYRWDSGSGTFKYTFYEPPRTAAVTPDRTFTRDSYFNVSRQRYSLEDIRNVIQVPYTDANGERQVVVVTDPTSIAKYGRRFMEVSEASTSGINTNAEATRMADAMLADLSEPRSFVTLVTPVFYAAELGDTIEIEKDGVTFDQAIKIVTYSVRHRVIGKEHRTEWTGRQVGGGYRDRWMESEVRPGIAPRQDLALDSNSVRAFLDGGTTQSIPSAAATTIVYDVEGYDFGGCYDPGTGEYTAPQNGLYEIKAGAEFAPSGAITGQIDVFRNGTRVAFGDTRLATGSPEFYRVSTVQQLEATDVITVRFTQNGAGAEDINGGRDTYLIVRRQKGGA